MIASPRPRLRRIAVALLVAAPSFAGCECGDDATGAAAPVLEVRDRRELEPPEPTRGGFFPQPMAFDGRTVVAGQRDADNRLRLWALDPRGLEPRTPIDRPADTDPYAFFGREVAVLDDALVVGAVDSAPTSDENVDVRGEAHLFTRRAGAWERTEVLRPADLPPEAAAGFGTALAIDAHRVVVGAPYFRGGAVFVFRRTPERVTHEATLRPPRTHEWLGFGSAVALDDERVAVGAPLSADFADGAPPELAGGRAYVYRRGPGGWSLEADLSPDELEVGSELGAAVALEGDLLAVGAVMTNWIHARGERAADGGVGEVHLFRRVGTEWSHEARLSPSNAASLQFFGSSLALVEGLLAVGAPGARIRGRVRDGGVYLFERCAGRWVERRALESAEPWDGDAWGRHVVLAGAQLAIGAFSSRHAAADPTTARGHIVVATVAGRCSGGR